ncbi:manganese/zinc/iron transport system permease protein [Paenibacillus uliginis N3/975]|uniref:Manganese transport system membrane protein MntC n=1 Tax=Paenibacillus uliginis N3/975 TaxID=1313296 RepID=A0A1X7HGP0_9BACL|nr:metal ABC transporter permease [Paenibacillus uliginis]SMF86032.1 manganese/zinc/iron transport system permease protein [Paenibacillus uliginis N3/975]
MDTLFSPNTQWVLLSTLILGMAAGVIGCLAYWKRQSLMSDALSHAALPGVVIAFALSGTKSLPVMIAGAAVSSLIGAFMIQWIRSSSRIKEDTAMGMILSVFFGLGIMLLTIVNRSAGGNQSGLDSFIFGQAASMVRQDVYTMLMLAVLVMLVVIIAFKEWKLFLFDPDFAKGLGLSGRLMNTVYLAVLVLVIVIGIQAVGVILMSALLIIPAVSARYWTHSFKWMVILSAVFGGGAGMTGTMISTLGKGWPTGPFIVVSSSVLFVISLVFGAEKGLLIQALQLRSQRKQHVEQSQVWSRQTVSIKEAD